MVSDNLPPGEVTSTIMSISYGSIITFFDKDLVPEECHSLPLCLTIQMNGVRIDSILIDSRASVNICPSFTLKRIGVDENRLEPVTTTVFAYDNTRRPVQGKIILRLSLGPAIMNTEFLVLDIPPTFKAILGRPWLKQIFRVSSTIHQCIKSLFKEKF